MIYRHDRLIVEWLEGGRQLDNVGSEPTLTVTELVARFWKFAQRHYRKNGEPTAQLGIIKGALKPVRELYGRQNVTEFGPKSLKAVRRKMIESGHCRNEMNRRVRIVKQCFAWGVSEELVPAVVDQRLRTVAGLREGRTKARESAEVQPVPEADIQATLPYLRPTVADMVRFQRLTGCRPHEVCMIRPCDLDRRGDVWVYRPGSHKNEHHGKERIVHIGPKAQAVLSPYLLRETDTYCFSPRDSEKRRRAELTANVVITTAMTKNRNLTQHESKGSSMTQTTEKTTDQNGPKDPAPLREDDRTKPTSVLRSGAGPRQHPEKPTF